ncbi:MAG: amidohydrolase family protein, partial [Candidatus Aminicenantaceae bacterium]
LNPENSFIPIARKRGVTAALTAPGEGNLLSGQSALIHLSGKTMEEMVVKFPVAVHGSLGEMPKLRYGKKGKMPSTRMGEAVLLRQTLIDAQNYLSEILDYEKKLEEYKKKEKEREANPSDKPFPPSTDFKLRSLIPVIKGEMFLALRANRLDDILTALRIAEEFHLKIIINHGADAYKVADKLSSRNIPVLVGPVASYFQMLETRGALYENVVRLHKAGVKIAFQTGSVKNGSDLLYQAEMAVNYGLPYEEAIKAMTLYPAQIFGVESKLGSLDKGKIANVVIFEGDPLKRLSKVRMVIIKGEILEKQ